MGLIWALHRAINILIPDATLDVIVTACVCYYAVSSMKHKIAPVKYLIPDDSTISVGTSF